MSPAASRRCRPTLPFTGAASPRRDALYRLQTLRLGYLGREHTLAVRRLNTVLVTIYEPDEPSTTVVMLGRPQPAGRTRRGQLPERDRHRGQADHRPGRDSQAPGVGDACEDEHGATPRAAGGRVLAARTEHVAIPSDQLLSSRRHLVGPRAGKSQALAHAKAQEREEFAEWQSIKAASAQLAAKIQASEIGHASSSDSTTGTRPQHSR